LSENEIIAILDELGDLVTALGDAEPEQKLDVYRNVGLHLTYDPEHEPCGQVSILPRTLGVCLASDGRHRRKPRAKKLSVGQWYVSGARVEPLLHASAA